MAQFQYFFIGQLIQFLIEFFMSISCQIHVAFSFLLGRLTFKQVLNNGVSLTFLIFSKLLRRRLKPYKPSTHSGGESIFKAE